MRRFRDQETTTSEVYLGDIAEQLDALGALVEEVRRGQEPIELTEVSFVIGEGTSRPLFIMPRHIVAFARRPAEAFTWVDVGGEAHYTVNETPEQISSMLRRGGRPLS